MRIGAALLAAAWAAAFAHTAVAAEGAWQLKLGEEYDSNASRLTGSGVEGAFATRLFGQAGGSFDLPETSRLRGSVAAAGRIVHGTQAADALTLQAGVGSAHNAVERLQLATSLDYRERLEWPSQQDYRSFAGSGRATVFVGAFDLWVAGGGEVFAYKPDADLSYAAPGVDAGVVWYPHDAWTLSASWGRDWRGFDAYLTSTDDTGAIEVSDERRSDTVDVIASELRWSSGVFRASAGWELRLNRSNAVARGYQRNAGEFSFAWAGIDDLLVCAQARLQRTSFDEGVFVDVSTNLDDEDRNSVSLALDYPIVERLSVDARVVRLAQSFGGALADYERWVVYFGVGTSSLR